MKPINLQFHDIVRKEQDVKKLNKLKNIENKKIKELVRIKVLNGYVYTNRPEDYEHLKR